MSKKVKIFSSEHRYELEEEIHKYAEENELEILNISLSTYSNGYGCIYNIAVVYKEKE